MKEIFTHTHIIYIYFIYTITTQLNLWMSWYAFNGNLSTNSNFKIYCWIHTQKFIFQAFEFRLIFSDQRFSSNLIYYWFLFFDFFIFLNLILFLFITTKNTIDHLHLFTHFSSLVNLLYHIVNFHNLQLVQSDICIKHFLEKTFEFKRIKMKIGNRHRTATSFIHTFQYHLDIEILYSIL